VVTLSICNRGASAATVQVAICTAATAATPDPSEYIEFDTSLSAKGVLERTGIVMDADQKISGPLKCNKRKCCGLRYRNINSLI
jgi:hypothetical protein